MKKIFILTLLIFSTIFIIGCNQNKQMDQAQNNTIAETKQEDKPSAEQNNPSNENKNTSAANSQNSTENKKTNNTTTNKTSKKDFYLKKLDGIQAKIDKDYNFENTVTTADMRNASVAQYKLWDDALNEIYKDLQNTLSSDDKKKLKEEELAWISKKENDAKNSANEVKGGTLEPVNYSLSLADSTKKRCYELVNKYMN